MTSRAHIVPDGHIERSVQIVVRDREIEVEIRICISETTQQQIMERNSGEKGDVEKARHFFQDWIGKQISDHSQMTINGNKIDLRLTKVVPNPRRHVDYALFMSTTIPPDFEEVKLEFDCNAITNFPGNWRGAIKTKGNAMIGNTKEAPILIRAKAIDLTDLAQRERDKIEKIIAKILIPK